MASLRSVALLLVVLLAGCSLDANAIAPAMADGGIDGEPGGDTGVVRTDGDVSLDTATPPTDAAMHPDVGIDPDGCGGPTTLLDDFEDGVRAPFWSLLETGPIRTRETGGALVVEPATTAGASGYVSSFAVDARESWISVRADGVAGSDPELATRLAVTTPSNSAWLAISVRDSMLSFEEQTSAGSDAASVPYDPVVHRWWRIRETGGTVFWETSADGMAWAEGRSTSSPGWMHRCRFEIGVLTDTAAVATANARFDDVNYDTPYRPRQRFCPIDALVDALEGGARSPEWSVSGAASCEVAQGSSHVRLTSIVGTQADCGFQTTTAYDLRDGSVFVDVPAITNFESILSYGLYVTDADGESQFVAFRNDEYVFRDASAVSYDQRRYWRIREEGGELFFESSGNASDWSVLARESLRVDASAVMVGLRLSTSAPATRSIGISALGVNVD